MTKYFIDDEEVEEQDFWQQLEDTVREHVESNIDDIIDDENEEIHIGSLTFNPSYVLKKCDPIAYSLYSDDEFDFEFSDAKDQIECGGDWDVDNHTFRTEEVDDDEVSDECGDGLAGLALGGVERDCTSEIE